MKVNTITLFTKNQRRWGEVVSGGGEGGEMKSQLRNLTVT